MRILIITQYFWPENFRINDLAKGLKEDGNDVTVLTGIPNYPGGRFFPGYGLFRNLRQDYSGAKVLRIPVIPRGKGGILRLLLSYFSFTISAIFLSVFLCRGKFDIIFFSLSPVAEGLPAVLLKKLKGAFLIFWVVDLWPDSLTATNAVHSPFILRWVDKLVRLIYKQCDSVLVSSEGFISSISAKGVDSGKIVFFPNWAEDIYRPVKLKDAKLPLALEELPQGFKLMFAGNIGAAQDFQTILTSFEMLKNHKDIHLLVLGKGRMYGWVKEQVKARNLARQVHLLGAYPSETMPDFFSVADAMLVTLRKASIFSMTIPSKLQSYLACGKPIIGALGAEGSRLIGASKSGIACPSGEPEALSRSILEMYQVTPLEREEMGRNAREYYEKNFDREMSIDNFNSLIKTFKFKKE